jgi:hypothetical protein
MSNFDLSMNQLGYIENQGHFPVSKDGRSRNDFHVPDHIAQISCNGLAFTYGLSFIRQQMVIRERCLRDLIRIRRV